MEVINKVTPVEKVMHGTVVWFSSQKGFGFVQDKATGDEYFCHFSAIQSEGYKSLKQNETVSFTVGIGPRGKLQAANVTVINHGKAKS